MIKKLSLSLLVIALLVLIGMTAQRWAGTLSEHEHPHQLQTFSDADFYNYPDEVFVARSEPIHPIPQLKPVLAPALQQRVNLGRKLFHDPRLSGNNTLSCATCHQLASGGADPRGISIGITGEPLRRNSPTVYNATFNAHQFWDGRVETLLEQADKPITHPQEMGANWPLILQRLQQDPALVEAFAIYPQGITQETILDAIVLFERTLVTPNSPFDRYLLGDEDALTQKQKQGYALFKNLGCISCHQGRNLGSNLFQRIGVYATHQQLSNIQLEDQGRFEVTGNTEDLLLFKVPTLRNIALTAPYFHDGSRLTLESAIHDMGALQLGKILSTQQIEQITQFLHSLTGELTGAAP